MPDTLARSGFTVVSSDGPEEYNAYEVQGGEVRVRQVGQLPKTADLVYTHRPIDELPEIVDTIVEGAGLSYIEAPYIADAVQARRASGAR